MMRTPKIVHHHVSRHVRVLLRPVATSMDVSYMVESIDAKSHPQMATDLLEPSVYDPDMIVVICGALR